MISMNFDTIDDLFIHIARTNTEAAGTLLDDKAWPLFQITHANGSGLMRSTVAFQLMQPIGKNLSGVGKDYYPTTFSPAKALVDGQKIPVRDLFLKRTGLDRHPDICRDFFPYRDDHSRGLPQVPSVHASAELNLAVRLRGESDERFVMLLRDDMAGAYPDCFTSPGGMLDRSPLTNSIKEANEELALVVRQNGKNYLLFLYDGDHAGITAAEKRGRLALTLQRLKTQHSAVFATATESDFELLPVKLRENPKWDPFVVNVTLTAGDFVYTGRHTVINETPIHAFNTQRNLIVPDEAGGVSLRGLVWGENLFGVDCESPFFERHVHALTGGEILYARYPNGIGAPEPSRPSVHPHYGGLINVARSLSVPLEAMGHKPADGIIARAFGETVKNVFLPNFPENKGGPFRLVRHPWQKLRPHRTPCGFTGYRPD
jgi:hypothetical protein